MSADVATLVKSAIAGELGKLHEQVKQVAEPIAEVDFWRKPIEPGNSLGHLVLHLTGNLSFMIGACLGNTGYVRDREREFTETNVPTKAEALARLDDAVATARSVIESLSPEQFSVPHPQERFGQVLPALLTFLTHFAVHRGQMSYIVRLLGKS